MYKSPKHSIPPLPSWDFLTDMTEIYHFYPLRNVIASLFIDLNGGIQVYGLLGAQN